MTTIDFSVFVPGNVNKSRFNFKRFTIALSSSCDCCFDKHPNTQRNLVCQFNRNRNWIQDDNKCAISWKENSFLIQRLIHTMEINWWLSQSNMDKTLTNITAMR